MDPAKNNVEAVETTGAVEIAVLADSDSDDKSPETVGKTAYWTDCLTEGQWMSSRVSGSAGSREAYASKQLLRRDILVADHEARYGLTITGLSSTAAGAEGTEAVHVEKASDHLETCAPTSSQTVASDAHIKAVMVLACFPLDKEKALLRNGNQQRLHVVTNAGEIDYVGMRSLEQNLECTANVQYLQHFPKRSSEPRRVDAATSCRRC
jgi:hypothetical protein